MNKYHEALLIRSVNSRNLLATARKNEQHALECLEMEDGANETLHGLEWSSEEIEELVRSRDAVPLLKKRHSDRTVMASLAQLIACRLQEGYTVTNFVVMKSMQPKTVLLDFVVVTARTNHIHLVVGSDHLEVTLSLPWREGTTVFYRVTGQWPDKGLR